MEPTLESIRRKKGLTQEELQVPCSAEDCNKIALKLVRWKELCSFIGLTPQDEEEVESTYKSYQDKKIGMLRLWREKKASEATYLGLAKGFECLELRDMIEQLLDLYSARRQAGGFQFQDPQQEHGVPRIDDMPKPHQMICVKGQSGKEVVIRDQLASCWEDLLLKLEFEPYMIKNIRRNTESVEDACKEVLSKWVSEHPSTRRPVTWRTLIQVIECLDPVLASDLKQELLP